MPICDVPILCLQESFCIVSLFICLIVGKLFFYHCQDGVSRENVASSCGLSGNAGSSNGACRMAAGHMGKKCVRKREQKVLL